LARNGCGLQVYEQVPGAAVPTHQLAETVDKLVTELDALTKSPASKDNEATMASVSDGPNDDNKFIDLTSTYHSQFDELQQLLQVTY